MSKPITSNQQVDPAGKRSAATTKVFVLGNTNYYYHLPAERVHQLPHRVQTMEKLVLCPSYDPASPTGSCKMGARCRLVHGDTRNLEPSTVHVNYAWRTLDDVTIPRYPAGETLHVAAPNSRNATDVMDSGCVLATQALQSKRRPLTHCAHYYFNRQCNLGAECRFIHAVFIDSTAASLRRAPAPVQLGRRLRFPDAAKHILGSDTDFQDQSSVCDPELEYDDDAMASHGWAQSAVSQQAQPPTNFAYPTPGMLSILSPFAVLPYLLPSPTAALQTGTAPVALYPTAPAPSQFDPASATHITDYQTQPSARVRHRRQSQPASTTCPPDNTSMSNPQPDTAYLSKPTMTGFSAPPSTMIDTARRTTTPIASPEVDHPHGRQGHSRRQHLPYSASPVRVLPLASDE
jgi:hypothetical protein